MSTLGDDLDKLAQMEIREKELAEAADKAKQERAAFERDVFDRMVAEGWEPGKSSLNRNGFKFRPSTTDFAVVQDADALRAWLMTYDEGLVEDKFKKAELNRIVRERLDNGEALPPGLGYHTKTAIHKSGIAQTQEDDDES